MSWTLCDDFSSALRTRIYHSQMVGRSVPASWGSFKQFLHHLYELTQHSINPIILIYCSWNVELDNFFKYFFHELIFVKFKSDRTWTKLMSCNAWYLQPFRRFTISQPTCHSCLTTHTEISTKQPCLKKRSLLPDYGEDSQCARLSLAEKRSRLRRRRTLSTALFD